MALAVWIVAMADLLLTARGIQLGRIEEANPLMARLLAISLHCGVVTTVLVLTAALTFLHLARHRVPWVNRALRGVLAIRLAVLSLHLMWVFG